jgi:hypothetical protein
MSDPMDYIGIVTTYEPTNFKTNNKAIRFKRPLVATAEKVEVNNTYTVNLYYPFFVVTLRFDANGDFIDYEVTDVLDVINALLYIYDELRKLEG